MIEFIKESWWLWMHSHWSEYAKFIYFVGVITGAFVSVGAAWIWSFFL